MKRNFTRVDRVAQMTMQEELIAKKKLEILEKQRTKEIGKQIAAAQKNVATSICTPTKDASEEEEKQPSETKDTSSTTTSPALHPLIAAANIPKLQNNFCNDGSFFEYYKKIIEQTKQEEEAKKQAEAKLKNEINIVTEEEIKTESQISQSDVMIEDVNELNEQKNIEIKNEVTENQSCDDENMNKEVENNSLIKEEQEQTQSDEVKTEIIDTVNVNCQETLVCVMNSSNPPKAPPSPYNEPLKQYNIKAENQHYNQSFPANNAPSIPVTTRPNFLPGPFPTQLTSQSNAMPLHMQSAFSIPPNTAFNLNLPPPMINFAIQQPAPPPPPPPMPVLLPLPQPAPNLFQSSFSNPSIFLMQHQTPPQITIPYQQQTQQMSITQQQPQPVQIIQNSPLQQVTQVAVSQPSPVTLQPSPVTLQPSQVTLQPSPVTLQPSPVSLQPSPVTLQPAPVTLQPASVNLQPAAVTLQPSPITLQPSPVTLQTSSEISQSSQPSPVTQTFQQPFHTAEITQSSASTDEIQDNLSRNDDDIEEMKTEIKSSSSSDQQSYDSNRSNTNSPVIEKDIKNAVFSEDSKPIDQTKSLLPTSLQSCIEIVAENGDAFEDFIRSKKDEVHSSLWFLFDMESDEYGIYRQSIVKIREEIRNRKRQAIYKSNDEKYDPESVCDDRDDNDSDDEYMKGMLNRNTNNLKRRIETRVEFEEEERRQAEEERQKKRKSRWGEKIDSNSLSTVTAVVQTSFANQNKPMLSNIQRTDPALLQYAKLNYGGINLSEEEWNKCEEHFKVNLLYQDMMRKRLEIDQLAQSGKFKYEYDSDEDTEGGTWEHKLRMAEMEATNAWASALTKQSEGKHHIGDFLPPEELKKFMEQYEAKKNNRQPDLSDYKEFKLKEDNKGFQMLQKLGWQEGQGLGAGGDGIVDPINKATQREANQGLGANSASTPGDGDNEYEAYRKRMMLAYRFRPNPLNNPRRAYY